MYFLLYKLHNKNTISNLQTRIWREKWCSIFFRKNSQIIRTRNQLSLANDKLSLVIKKIKKKLIFHHKTEIGNNKLRCFFQPSNMFTFNWCSLSSDNFTINMGEAIETFHFFTTGYGYQKSMMSAAMGKFLLECTMIIPSSANAKSVWPFQL